MSFRLKTVLGIAVIELTVMAILIGFNQFALGGSATTQLFERAEATARIFGNLVSDAVVSTDLATLDATIETAVSTEELSYLRIRNSGGLVLSEGGSAEALSRPFEPDASFETAISDSLIDISVPITVAGLGYGTVEMGISTTRVEEEIAQAFRLNIIVAAIGMSLVAVFGYGLGSMLTAQLHCLRRGARAISSGDLGHQIPIRGRDELADTAHCFNDMARTLAGDRAVLQHKQDELLAKKARVEVIVSRMTDISKGGDDVQVPDVDRFDEIGDMARATVVFQDTMRAVEQARLEQQRLISAFDQVAEQVVVFGLDGRALFLNGAFRRFNRAILQHLDDGFTLERFLRAGCAEGEFPGLEDNEAWIAEQLARQSHEPVEIRRRPDRILLSVLTHVPGVGTVLSEKDVTELRRSERRLVQASKLATLGEMATGVAHELNQPLGVIRMAATNCVKRIDRGKVDNDYMKSKLARIEEQTERASQIINHMRIFGRKADGHREPFDLCAALGEVASLARTQLHTLDISCHLKLPESPVFVLGEKVLFEQVLLNLISNARDAIESQGHASGTISLETEFDQAGQVSILIRDTGGGIPEEILDRLFEPFFTTKEPGKGTGLGLSISFGTIQDMSGTLTARNEGDGACFAIDLPTVGAEVAEAS